MSNPYTRVAPSNFDIAYVGDSAGFHCLHVNLSKIGGMPALMFKKDIVDWAMEVPEKRAFVGNGFKDSKRYPPVTLPETNAADVYVLIENIVDLVRFGQRFAVKGFSPDLVA